MENEKTEFETLTKEYREKLTGESLEPRLVDYLCTLFANLLTQSATLNGFTKTNIEIRVY